MTTTASFSADETHQVVALLTSRGYFHDGVEPRPASMARGFDSGKEKQDHSPTDPTCQVVLTKNGIMTRMLLRQKLQNILVDCGGRLSCQDASHFLGVESIFIDQSITERVLVIGEDLVMVDRYMDEMMPSIQRAIVEAIGCLRVPDLAHKVLSLPVDLVLQKVESTPYLLEKLSARIINMSGVPCIVTPDFEKSLRAQVRGAFRAVQSPTPVDSVCQQLNSDFSQVQNILDGLCVAGEVEGTVHGSTATGAMYVPDSYIRLQRQSVDQYFEAHGFLTIDTAQAMGLGAGTFGAYVQESFPEASVLQEMVIMDAKIVNPLLPVIQDAAEQNSFADLRMHMNEALLQHEEDVECIVQDKILPNSSAGGGVLVWSSGEALFVTSGMMKDISSKVLPPLVEAFAKERALEIDQANNADDGPSVDRDDGKKTKKSKKKGGRSEPKLVHCGLVPLKRVAIAVLKHYPDLADVQESHDPIEGIEKVNWETDDDEVFDESPVLDLCRRAVFNSVLEDSCRLAVHAELEKIQSSKKSSAVLSRKDGAARVRFVETSFEDATCFAAACYQLQVHVKLLNFVEVSTEVDEHTAESVRKYLLQTNCAGFASRITQYCLFKNELEEIFSVAPVDEGTHMPNYYDAVDRSARSFPKPYLSCRPDLDGNIHLPLPTMRKILSGSLGVTLARLWTHCGGSCYDGGTEVCNDGTVYAKPGNVGDFLAFIEENCLTTAGIPFKKLDKKAEKQFMFARRQGLTQALEGATEAVDILELSVVLLFQQLSGVAVAGPLVLGPILQLLLCNNKMPQPVAREIKQLEQVVISDETADLVNVQRVKLCGLARDVTKHEVV